MAQTLHYYPWRPKAYFMKKSILAPSVFIMFALTTLTGFAAIAQMSKLAALTGKWEISGETNASLEIIDSSNILFTSQGPFDHLAAKRIFGGTVKQPMDQLQRRIEQQVFIAW